MTAIGVILFGPPASGKDTIGAALLALGHDYELFQRLRVSSQPKVGYRPISDADADEFERKGLVIYSNERYGNRYVVDTPGLDQLIDKQCIPVVHIGQVEGVSAVSGHRGLWLTVHLTCTRETTAARSEHRGDLDIGSRLAAWDETEADLRRHHSFVFGLTIDTDLIGPIEAARLIHQAVAECCET